MVKKSFLFVTGILVTAVLFSQSQTVQKLTSSQIEALFLEKNLELIAEYCNINIADVAAAQAKLWENPNLSVGQVNLWSTNEQRENGQEMIPPIFGSFGRNLQFSVELNQIIQTAGKRKKRIRKEEISKEMAVQEFEKLLKGLKTELRKSIQKIIYLQAYQKVLSQRRQTLNQLIEAYKRQVKEGNIGKNELFRLQSSLLELENEINEIQTDYNERQRIIKSLLNADPMIIIEIEDINRQFKNPAEISLINLMTQAASRPDLKYCQLQTQYHENSLAYEKTQRIPDIEISAVYDRYGGVWKNYIGFGVSIDLPVFNQNQGNIRAARFEKEQSHYIALQYQNLARQEISEAFSNYVQAYDFYEKISGNDLLSEIDQMHEAYTRNLLNRNVSMIEYIDFMEAYMKNKQTVLSAREKIENKFEELQHAAGVEIK